MAARIGACRALARSGLLALTGWPDDPPVWPPPGLPAHLDALARDVERLTWQLARPVRISWEAAVTGRAALLGLGRRGRISANGSCRLLRTPDGWVALNLPRRDDMETLPALTGLPLGDPWDDAAAAAGHTPSADFVTQARLLGLAVAELAAPGGPAAVRQASVPWEASAPWKVTDPWKVSEPWARRAGPVPDTWRVVDLSSLWAGPMVARVLAEAGAVVTKVESAGRPDAARRIPSFYNWVHAAGETTVEVDLGTRAGRQHAAALIDEADVVIEGSRPRALEQLGLGPGDRPGRAGRVWLSVTGYGRDAPGRDWVAFGDDAAVAGGLVGWDQRHQPVFCGDAIADPLTGLVGAVAVLRALEAGGGRLIDLAMSRAAAAVGGSPAGAAAGAASGTAGRATGETAVRAGGGADPAGAGGGADPPGAGGAADSPGAGGAALPAAVAIERDGTRGWVVRAGHHTERVRDRPATLAWVRAGR